MFAIELICRQTQYQNQSKHIIKSHFNVFRVDTLEWWFAPSQHETYPTFRNRNRIVNLNACIKLWCRMKVHKTHYIANCAAKWRGMRVYCMPLCMCMFFGFDFRVVWQVLNCMFKLFGTETIINIAFIQ